LSEYFGNLLESIENGGTKGQWVVNRRTVGVTSKVEYVFGGLFKVCIFGEGWKWEFLWEKINFEKIALTVCVFKVVTFIAAVMFEG